MAHHNIWHLCLAAAGSACLVALQANAFAQLAAACPAPLLCSQRWRETAAEKRELDRLQFDMINEVRLGSLGKGLLLLGAWAGLLLAIHTGLFFFSPGAVQPSAIIM